MTTREATVDDLPILRALFPELIGHALNFEQVVVLEDQHMVKGAALLFHGGHTFALVGSVRFAESEERPAWLARALWKGVKGWALARGITLVAHLAVTEECREAVERMGGTVRQPAGVFVEVPLAS